MVELKQIIKTALPQPIRLRVARLRAMLFGLDRKYANLSTAETFDKIYQEGIWGKDEQGNATSGPGSYGDLIVEPYIDVSTDFLKTLNDPIVVDLGCGDFNVGARLLPHAKRYIACDISSIILERNKLTYRAENLEFRQFNLVDDELPVGDVAFIRQVLQHLSNDDISKFVSKVNNGGQYKYLVVTEHLPAHLTFVPNRNKQKGASIRLYLGSGVDLAKEPFNLQFNHKVTLLDVPDSESEIGPSRIVTTLYELT